MGEFWVERGGVRLFVVEGGSGPAIVMLHGPMASHEAAWPLVAPCVDRFRIITPDLRGSGRSWCAGSLTFDELADDLAAVLDHVGVDRAVVGGVSGGSGVALRVALRHRDRTAGLVLVQPVYAGQERGYTESQRAAFTQLDVVASRAVEEGVQVLRPLYANLPATMRERAMALLSGLDPASVVATSRFLASGSQPFVSGTDLAAIEIPALVIRGDDALHPAHVSDFYVGALRACTTLAASTPDVPAAIGAFAERCLPVTTTLGAPRHVQPDGRAAGDRRGQAGEEDRR